MSARGRDVVHYIDAITDHIDCLAASSRWGVDTSDGRVFPDAERWEEAWRWWWPYVGRENWTYLLGRCWAANRRRPGDVPRVTMAEVLAGLPRWQRALSKTSKTGAAIVAEHGEAPREAR